MPRSVNNVASRAKRKRIMKLAKGFFWPQEECMDRSEERHRKRFGVRLSGPQTEEKRVQGYLDPAYQRGS